MRNEIANRIRALSMFERRVIAKRVGKKVQYLNNLAYTKTNASAEMANELHKATRGYLDRKLMCPSIDWDKYGD